MLRTTFFTKQRLFHYLRIIASHKCFLDPINQHGTPRTSNPIQNIHVTARIRLGASPLQWQARPVTTPPCLTLPLEHPLQLRPETIHDYPPRSRHLRRLAQHHNRWPTRPNLQHPLFPNPHPRRLRRPLPQRARPRQEGQSC
jgi:hypothetical protein